MVVCRVNVIFSCGCCVFFFYIVLNFMGFCVILLDIYVSDDDIVYFVIDY